jgi:uncharacterized RDD family membrane protein YckC
MQDAEISIFPERQTRYAGFWVRFGAALLDGLILMVPNYLIIYWMTGSIFSPGFFTMPQLITTIIGWLYFTLQESGPAQATLGKRALGIKVTDMDGYRVTFWQATGRHFGKWVSTIILLIGYLMMIWSSKRQTLHDMMAGTLVVNRDAS